MNKYRVEVVWCSDSISLGEVFPYDEAYIDDDDDDGNLVCVGEYPTEESVTNVVSYLLNGIVLDDGRIYPMSIKIGVDDE